MITAKDYLDEADFRGSKKDVLLVVESIKEDEYFDCLIFRESPRKWAFFKGWGMIFVPKYVESMSVEEFLNS